MKPILAFLAFLILAGCCEKSHNEADILIATDKSFSQMSVDKGLNTAFIFYAADSVVKMRDGNFPITGKNEMTEIYRSRPDSGMVLKWNPVKAEISRSGDLGYTFGNWELFDKSRDTTMYGNYLSIWKLQADGTWKYILDTGCNTPKPSGSDAYR
jgi:ketosteroid isomerase-like protein